MIIDYNVARSEVWSWYWIKWRRKLWKIHLIWLSIFVLTACFTIHLQRSLTFSVLSTVLMIGCSFLLAVACYPMLKYNAENRSLLVDETGIMISRGAVRKFKPWDTVLMSIEAPTYYAIEMKNGNALIVPKRAFHSPAQMESFEACLDRVPKR